MGDRGTASQAVDNTQSGVRMIGLLLLDASTAAPALHAQPIDGFHKVNARHGHAAGDTVLRILARRLRRSVGTDFAIARTCGDAYAVAGRMAHNVQSWRTLANHLLDEITRPVDLEMGRVSVTASLGIAMAPEHVTAAEPLLHAATRACEQSRVEGGNTLTSGRDPYRRPGARTPAPCRIQTRHLI